MKIQVTIATQTFVAVAVAIGKTMTGSADEVPDRSRPQPALTAANANELAGTMAQAPKTFTLGAYAEAFFQWNFNNPSNHLTEFRGFDNRHNTFTIANVAVDTQWDYRDIVGRATLQIGHTPSTYYLAEPRTAGSSSVNQSDADLWKYIQQAYVGYRLSVGRGLLVTGGIFLSPIGPEGMAVRDNWNWSRSNLFFGLPFYHAGVRVAYPLTDQWVVTLAGYNGWNNVVDNNDEKSIAAQVTYTKPDQLTLSLLYFAGVERPDGTVEGKSWRHLFDAHVTWQTTKRMAVLMHVNIGVEPNQIGTSAWCATAVYGRVKVRQWLYAAVRGDWFYEHVPVDAFNRSATPIFWPAAWVTSGTATLDFRPHERASVRLEYRHDHAQRDIYFSQAIVGDGDTTPFVHNRRYQDTFTIGATTWF